MAAAVADRTAPQRQHRQDDETERKTLALRESSGNPYQWDIDLTAVTLGNFNHRKMSLVRDYSGAGRKRSRERGLRPRVLAAAAPGRRRGATRAAAARAVARGAGRRHANRRRGTGAHRHQLHHPGAAGHGEVADHHQPHCRLRGPRPARAVRLREARRHRRGVPSPAAAGTGRAVLHDPRLAGRQENLRAEPQARPTSTGSRSARGAHARVGASAPGCRRHGARPAGARMLRRRHARRARAHRRHLARRWWRG
jgi:hypothetical protein